MDLTNHQQIEALGRRVLAGGQLEPPDVHWLFELRASADVYDLMAWANRIRERFKGRRVQLCSIVNIKAGGCPEDCKFCAQSAFYQTGAPRYGLIDFEPIRAAAAETKRNGVLSLGLVAAWRGLGQGPLLDQVCAHIRAVAAMGVSAHASLGLIQSQAVADRLKAAGLVCYNHNLETSERFFPKQCSTHSYQDRLQTLHYLRQAGIKICCGGIIGLGETRADRADLALAIRQAGAQMVPLNFLHPISGTPYQHNPPLPPLELLQTIACFRFVLPQADIMVAGGRVVNLRDTQSLMFMAGASALMVGNYLTTLNQPVEKDLQMIRDLGLEPGQHADLQPAQATDKPQTQPVAVAPAATPA
jgi:biotin synthase